MPKQANKHVVFLISIGLVLACICAFEPVRRNEFISFDDSYYIVDNTNIQSGLTREGIVWAFTTPWAYNWHPLTWISHMLDWQLYQKDPQGHHLTNVLLHIINSLLVFIVFRKMLGGVWSSAFIAAIFAVHPLHVESVVWASERKDVLSTFFWLCTMWAYLRYVRRPNIARYVPVIVLLSLGLMAKQMLVTLPMVLLLLDYWPLRRFADRPDDICEPVAEIPRVRLRQCILEKIPLLAVSAAASVIVCIVQKKPGVVKSVSEYPLLWRFANAAVAYVAYIGKMFWPKNLAIFYPHLNDTLPIWQIVAAIILLAAISTIVILKRRQCPYLVVGWLWYLGTLVPVIGFVQVGLQAYADRYTYVPLIGLFLIIVKLCPDIFTQWKFRKVFFSTSAVVVILLCVIGTNLQVKRWKDNETLYSHATKVVNNNWFAHEKLGLVYLIRGDLTDGLKHITQALRMVSRIKHHDEITHNSLGWMLARQEKFEEAQASLEQATRINPKLPMAYRNLAYVYSRQGKTDQANQAYKKALRLNPNYAKETSDFRQSPDRHGDMGELITKLIKRQKKPDLAALHFRIGYALYSEGKLDEAIGHYRKVLEIDPYHVKVHNNLGKILLEQMKIDEAIVHFRKAVELKPDYAIGRQNLKVALESKERLGKAAQDQNKSPVNRSGD